MLKLEQADGIHTITLDQPRTGNSLSATLVEAFHDALDQMEGVGRLLILRGEGKHFSTGFHLEGLETESDGDLLRRFVRIEQLLARIWSAPFLTLAICQGSAYGAGADLFTACGRRVAASTSRFSFPGGGFGLVLGTQRLAERVGEDVAARWIASGRVIDANAAVKAGLATDVADEADVAEVIGEEIAAALRLDLETLGQVRAAAKSRSVQADQALAALVRSASRPGLRDRIMAHRARAMAMKTTQ